MTLAPYITELVDAQQELKSGGLARLSGLLEDEQAELRGRWPEIAADRRRDIMARLVELAEDNADLDFHAVFCAALSDEDAVVRERAVGGLWESDDRRTIPKLTDRLRDDPDERVRAAAALVLGHFADLAADGKLLQRDAVQVFGVLMGILKDDEEQVAVRRRALESVAAFQVPDIEEWVRWGYESPEPELRQSALHAMGRSADPAWLPVIYREMESGDAAMRYEAATAAGALGEEKAIPHLVELVDDTDPEVAVASVIAMSAIGGAKAKKLLSGFAANGEDNAIQDAATEALRAMEVEEGDFALRKVDERLG